MRKGGFRRFLKIISWHVLAVLAMAGLFVSSSIPGEESAYASMVIASWVQYIIPISGEALNFIVRKTAHVAAYFVLGFCVAQAFKFYIKDLKKLLLSAWAAGTIYGILDEIHQYFVPGRVMALLDMILNSTGSFFGALAVVILLYCLTD